MNRMYLPGQLQASGNIISDAVTLILSFINAKLYWHTLNKTLLTETQYWQLDIIVLKTR